MTALAAASSFLDRLDPPPSGDALGEVRRTGLQRFADSGFPTRRSETWRYTDLRPLIEARFAAAPADEAALAALIAGLPDGAGCRLVFVDGRLDDARSRVEALPDGVTVESFARWADRHPAEAARLFDLGGGFDRAFLALNAAFVTDGVIVIVPDGIVLDRPIQLVHWSTGAASHTKSLIRLGRGAAATIVEQHAGSGAGWQNAAVSVELGEAARLGRIVLQTAPADSFHTAHLAATLGTRARLDGFLLSLGGRLARQDAEIVLAGAEAVCAYSGAYLLHGHQESVVRSLIRHGAPAGRSHQVFKGCIADRAHGAFQGKILVDPAAQKTDGYQLNKTILLGERASMDAKPELEIYADDVKCSHGATIGDLDETALFYLRSRGMPPAEARHMLIEAFVQDAIDLVEDTAIRSWLAGAVTARLGEVAP